ncbi:hypothetical protein JCM6882_007082 [Rhodosporidiobolus microsporus]
MLSRALSLLPLVALFSLLLLLDNAHPSLAQAHAHAQAHGRRALSPADLHNRHVARSASFGGGGNGLRGAAEQLQRRQEEAPGAAVQTRLIEAIRDVQVGDANPEAGDGEKNNFKVELPSRGSANGGITAFNRFREREKRQATNPFEQVGDANPAPAADDLNNRDDNTPVKSQQGAPAGMTDFKHRAAAKRSPFPFAHPVPRPDQLNMFPHHLAARGKADGSIEVF